MQSPAFIIQKAALSYQYFPKWTCLFIEKRYLNTKEKAEKSWANIKLLLVQQNTHCTI